MAAQMAADGGLRRLFEKPLLEALSAWNQHIHHPRKAIDPASFTEIFGELHFQEKQPQQAPPPPSPPPRPPQRTASWLDVAAEAEKSKDDSSLDALLRPKPASAVATLKRSASFYMTKSSASLLLCTEGLGSESAVDADDMLRDGDAEAALSGHGKGTEMDSGDVEAAAWAAEEGKVAEEKQPQAFPPPIRSIGRGGKPCVCFRSFRADGRLVLMEVVIPGKELLQACREGGRLRLQFANAAGVGVDEEMHGESDGDEGKSACTDES